MTLVLGSIMTFTAVFFLLVGVLAMRVQRLSLAAQLDTTDGQANRPPSLVGELDGSFRARVTAPLLAPLGALLQRLTPSGAVEQLQLKIERAGTPAGLTPRYFMAARFVFALAFIGVAVGCYMVAPLDGLMRIAAAGFVGVIGMLIPDYWL